MTEGDRIVSTARFDTNYWIKFCLRRNGLFLCTNLKDEPSTLVSKVIVVVVVVYLTLTDPLRIQPWSQDRRNQTKSNRKSEISRESRQKRTDKKVASKGHRRDKIENTNKNTQTVETN